MNHSAPTPDSGPESGLASGPDSATPGRSQGFGLVQGSGSPRRAAPTRVRFGVGAAVVLVVAAVVIAVVVGFFTGEGVSYTVSPSSGPGGVGAPADSPGSNSGANSPGANGTTEGPGSNAGGAGADSMEPMLFVHVLGAVASPGLYELGAGARVIDAIAAAGGFTDDADPAGVNLARPLADGEQLVVTRVGEVPASGTAPNGSASGGLVNLNRASALELEQLPRIGPEMAQRIITWRESNGPFSSVDDLLGIVGIGDTILAALRELVTV